MIEYNDLSDEQKNSFEFMTSFTESNDRQMVLKGYAGTGKSTLIKVFLDHIEKKTKYAIACTAPTNEAVRVIAKMSGRKYTDTIYSLLGLALIQEDDKEPVLVPQGKGKVKEFDIIIIDEASMIHGELFDLIQAQLAQFTFIKIIYVGDDAQLPPVKDPLKISKAFLLSLQTHLTNVQRCAADNPIIAMVTAIRNNLDTKIDQFERDTNHDEVNDSGVVFHDNRNEFMQLMFDSFKSDEYKADNNHVRAVAYTNRAVDAINLHIRRELFDKKTPDEYELNENLIVAEPVLKRYGRISEIVYSVGERVRAERVRLDKDDEFGFRYWAMKVVNYEADEEDKVVMNIKVIHKDDLKYYYGVLSELASEAKAKLRQTHTVKGSEKSVYTKSEAWGNYFSFKNTWSWVKYSYATTTHKCVSNDTLVHTTRGLVGAKDVCIGDYVYTYKNAAPRKVINKYTESKNSYIRLTTDSGRIINVGSEHVLMISNESGKYYDVVKNIREGDFLCVDRTFRPSTHETVLNCQYNDSLNVIQSTKFPHVLTSEFSWILGMLVGDGCYTYKDSRVDLAGPSNPELLELFQSIIESYGVTVGTAYRNGLVCSKFVYSNSFRDLLLYCGLERVKAPFKRVPAIIMNASSEHQSNFIKGLFDSDGSVDMRRKSVRLSTASHMLASDIQIMLSSLGVMSNLGKSHNQYYVSITGLNVDVYSERIGFNHQLKLAKLHNNISTNNGVNVNKDIIPYGYKLINKMIDAIKLSGKFVHKNLPSHGLYRPEFRKLYHSLNGVLNVNTRRLTYQTLSRLSAYLIDENIEFNDTDNTLLHNMYFDKIISIEVIDGDIDMVDFEVEIDNAFIGNGIVNHNCQGGTFKNVFVVERDLNVLTWDDVERNKLKYVAFTRASHLLRILQ